jgi:hypothetical protein
MPSSCLRVCLALCARQRGRDWYPHVIVSLDELAALAGFPPYMNKKAGKPLSDHGSLRRALRRLVEAGLLTVEPGAGKVPNKTSRKASIYRLGPAVLGVAEMPLEGVAEMPPLVDAAVDRMGVKNATPRTLSLSNEREGDRGGMSAALTGGSSPIKSLPEAIAPRRFRDLLEKTGLRKRSDANAL